MTDALRGPGTEIAILGAVTAGSVFGTNGGVDAILEKVRAHARSVESDISTAAGRQSIASLAYKIARSKTALDGMGKELGEVNYRAWKAITAERARIETELDALRDEVRAPLTAWENAEKARIKAHEDAIDAFVEGPQFYAADNSSTDLARRLRYLENMPDRDWQEFAKRAEDIRKSEIAKTATALTEAIRREAAADAAAKAAADEAAAKAAREEERQRQRVLAAAAQAREEAEQRAKIAAEAEARRVDAERRAATEAAEAERVKAKREIQEAHDRATKANADRIAAAAKAEADRIAAAEQAAAAERKRIADASELEAAQAAAREADRKHRGEIHSTARDALIAGGLPEDAATTAITLIAGRKVPGVTISY